MEVISIYPVELVERDAAEQRVRIVSSRFSNIQVCKVLDVDVANKVVGAYFFSMRRKIEGVPYCYPSYNEGCGVIVVPTVGSLGIAAIDEYGNPIIIGFTGPHKTNNNVKTRNVPDLKGRNIPDLLEGELLFKSIGGSLLKLDKLGGVTLASAIFAYMRLDAEGDYFLDVENLTKNINGVSEEAYTCDYVPYMKITKGKHLYRPIQNSEDSIELYYRLSVLKNGEEVKFVGVDGNCNIHVSGEIITYSGVTKDDC